jgi:hypothetical protein
VHIKRNSIWNSRQKCRNSILIQFAWVSSLRQKTRCAIISESGSRMRTNDTESIKCTSLANAAESAYLSSVCPKGGNDLTSSKSEWHDSWPANCADEAAAYSAECCCITADCERVLLMVNVLICALAQRIMLCNLICTPECLCVVFSLSSPLKLFLDLPSPRPLNEVTQLEQKTQPLNLHISASSFVNALLIPH